MKLIHKGLYREGLKQLTLIGIIFTAFFSLYAFFYPISVLRHASDSTSYRIHLVDQMEFNPLFIMAFLAFVPLMALYLFSFLNARNRSDFYHSMPHKRKTVFCSYSLSILTWLMFALVTCSLISFILYLFGARYVTLDIGAILIYILGCATTGVLVLGATLLAMSLTGSVFSNIVTTALILYLPRMISGIFVLCVNEESRLLVPSKVLSFLSDNSFYIPIGFDFTWQSALYTGVVGVIYLFLAGIAFSMRKSESAGNAAVNKGVQTVIRLALSFAVCALALALLSDGEGFPGLVVFCIALIVYFSYELITQKKLRALKGTLPGLLILLGLNLAFVAGVQGIVYGSLHVNWAPEKIESFSYQTTGSNYTSSYYEPDYEDLVISKVEIKDPAVIEVLSGILTKNQQDERTGARGYRYASEIVEIKMKSGRVYTRRYLVDESKQKELYNALMKSDVLKGVEYFPKEPERIGIETNYLSVELAKAEAEDLYALFLKESEALTINHHFARHIPGYQNDEEPEEWQTAGFNNQVYGTLWVSGFFEGETYASSYDIDADRYPETTQWLLDHFNEEAESFVKRALQNGIQGGEGEQDSDITGLFVNTMSARNPFIEVDIYETEKLEAVYAKLLAAVKDQNGKPVDIQEPVCIIYFRNQKNGEATSYAYYVNLDLETYTDLLIESGEVAWLTDWITA